MKYQTVKNLLLKFEALYNTKITFDSIDFNFFDNFRNLMYSIPNKKNPNGFGLTDDSINKYLSVFKTFMLWALERNFHQNPTFIKFSSPKKEKHEIITLKASELKQIEAYIFEGNEQFENVRNLFLFLVYTGQRWSDVANFSNDQIQRDEETGKHYWCFQTKKTKSFIKIPLVGELGEKTLRILEMYGFNLPKISQ